MNAPRTFSGTPLDERMALCRDLYLTTHNTCKRETSMASELPPTHSSECTATGISRRNTLGPVNIRQ